VAALITGISQDKQEVPDICTVLNTWITMKDAAVVEIPERVVRDFITRVQGRSQ
jgi:hypothetical protein